MTPRFIREKFHQHKKEIIWIDSDAIVVRYPTYFDVIEEDIAVFFENKEKLWNGVTIFQYNDRVSGILDAWVENIEKDSKTNEMIQLQKILDYSYHFAKTISLLYLPDAYCYIEGISKKCNPVIFQRQASRSTRGGKPIAYIGL